MIDATRIYLAGPIQHKEETGLKTWREVVEEKCKDSEELNPFNPLYMRLPDGRFKTEIRDEKEVVHEYQEEIVESDLREIRNCEAMMVNWEKGVETAGTPMEMIYGKQHSVDVVIVFDGDVTHLSPWLNYHSDKVVDSFDEAIEYIKNNV